MLVFPLVFLQHQEAYGSFCLIPCQGLELVELPVTPTREMSCLQKPSHRQAVRQGSLYVSLFGGFKLHRLFGP